MSYDISFQRDVVSVADFCLSSQQPQPCTISNKEGREGMGEGVILVSLLH